MFTYFYSHHLLWNDLFKKDMIMKKHQKHLGCNDNKSKKFWEIEVENESLTTDNNLVMGENLILESEEEDEFIEILRIILKRMAIFSYGIYFEDLTFLYEKTT